MKILITGALPLAVDDRVMLESMGFDVTYHADEGSPVSNPNNYEAIVCNALFQYQPIERFKCLKLIQLTSAGFDRVPLEYIKSHGIRLYNAQGVYSIPMAEFALCGVLQLYKQSRFFEKNQQHHHWLKHRGLQELTGKMVCIVGTGSVGIEVAKRFSVFGVYVSGIDLYPKDIPYFDTILGIEYLDELLKKSDIVILTLPLSDVTRRLFDDARMKQIKAGAILVNIARGAIVDEAAMIKSLQSGHLSGAIIDVFEEEPLPIDSPLWNMNNVIITPHNSFVSDMTHQRLMDLVASNITNYISEEV